MNTIYDKKRLTPAQIQAIKQRQAILNALLNGHKGRVYNPIVQLKLKQKGKGKKQKKCACGKKKVQKGRGPLDIRNHHMSLGDMKFTPFY